MRWEKADEQAFYASLRCVLLPFNVFYCLLFVLLWKRGSWMFPKGTLRTSKWGCCVACCDVGNALGQG